MSFAIDRLPRMRPVALAFALALAAIGLAMLEGTFHLKGFPPSISDSDSLWALSRVQAEANNVGIILIGSSRFQLGIEPTILSQEANTSVINLASHGVSPFPFLDDLVKSEVRPDVILIEYIPLRWVNEFPESYAKAISRLNYFHSRPYAAQYEVFLRAQLGTRWVVLNPVLNVRTLPLRLINHNDINSTHRRTHPNRFIETIGKNNPEKLTGVVGHIPDKNTNPDFWIKNAYKQLDEFENNVATLQNSGTRVVVFQPPVCNEQLILDRETYGEPALFNALKQRSKATWIAAEDLGQLDIDCVDLHHLTTQSAYTVTKALAKSLNALSTSSTL